jgi:hypothetical protein
MTHWQRLENHRIHQPEDCGIGSNAKGKRKNRERV